MPFSARVSSRMLFSRICSQHSAKFPHRTACRRPALLDLSRDSSVSAASRSLNNLFALIARSVGRHEMLNNPKAIEAMDKEWQRLMKKKVWDLLSRRELAEVAKEANRENRTIHMGRVFGLMVEKNFDLL